MAPPVGLTGSCGESLGAEHPFQLALSVGGLSTDIDFNSTTQRLDELSTAVALTYRLPAWSVQASLGLILGGSLDGGFGNYRLEPGVLASLAGSYTILDGSGALPYLAVTLTAGVATAGSYNETDTSDRPQLTALDFRLSAVIGKRFFGFWLPYAGVAVFGGPVYFSPQGQSLVGTDEHHFRLSIGSSFSLSSRFEAFVEVGFLGEQNAVVGIGYAL